MHVTPILTSILIGSLPFAAMAQTFNGGDLDDGANWTGGLPTSGTGTVNTDGSFDTTTPVTGRVWNVNQTGGTITQTVNTTAVDFDGGSWTQSGGNLNLGRVNFSDFDLILDSGATFNQQNTNGESLFQTGSSITVNSGATFNGSGNGNDYIRDNSGTSIFTVNGGTVNNLSIRGNYTVNLNSGTASFQRILGFTGTVNMGASGTFTSTSDTRTPIGWKMDWAVGSTATAATEDADWAETMWDGGFLFYNGFNNATIGGSGATWTEVTTAGGLDGTHSFDYTGQTLSVIPEPSSIALLGLAGLAVYLVRRRK
jgi:hypothetical protein